MFILWILKKVGIAVWPLRSTQQSLTGTFPNSKPDILQKYIVQEYKMLLYWKMNYLKLLNYATSTVVGPVAQSV